MALRHTVSTFMVFLLLALSFSCGLTSAGPKTAKATNDLIGEICAKTINSSLCLQTLKSEPRAAKADAHGLGQISIDLANAAAKSAMDVIGALVKETNDQELKKRYDSCSENYDDAISYLEQCQDAFKSRDYASLNIYASAASTNPDTCDDTFDEPPAAPAKLREANQKLEGLCSIILVISNRLAGRN